MLTFTDSMQWVVLCLTVLAGGTALLLDSPWDSKGSDKKGGKELSVKSIKLLSRRGSTRAVFYHMSTKIITMKGKTHVAWLNSISETMVATYDHASENWTEPVKVGTGMDNHGGPALSCDSQGYLHIVLGPHHGAFHHYRSARPNDSTTWIDQGDFGVRGTYPSLVCDDQDTLHIIYRSSRATPWQMVYQRLNKGGTWSTPRALASPPAGYDQYTAFDNTLLITGDNTLHIGYDILHTENGVRHCQVGHMVSHDRGETWTLADGSPINLPVTPADNVFVKREANVLGMALDSQGRPWIHVAVWGQPASIYHHDGKTWRSFEPQQRLVQTKVQLEHDLRRGGWRWGLPMTIDSQDRIYMTFSTLEGIKVVYSTDQAESFRVLDIFPRDQTRPFVGLSIERPTGHNAVETPFLLFCTGRQGSDCFGRGIFHDVRAVQLSWKAAR